MFGEDAVLKYAAAQAHVVYAVLIAQHARLLQQRLREAGVKNTRAFRDGDMFIK